MFKVSLQNILGDALWQVRKSRRLTQQAVAKLGGVAVPTIRLLERGRGNLRTWAAVLDVLGVELVGRNLPAGEHIGWQVAALRKRRGLGQREVAALVGVSQPTLIALEREGRGRVHTLDRVLRVLGAGAYLAPQGSVRPFYTHAGSFRSGSQRLRGKSSGGLLRWCSCSCRRGRTRDTGICMWPDVQVFSFCGVGCGLMKRGRPRRFRLRSWCGAVGQRLSRRCGRHCRRRGMSGSLECVCSMIFYCSVFFGPPVKYRRPPIVDACLPL
jgi:transcriptional regulator with XRE-family HTH domain